MNGKYLKLTTITIIILCLFLDINRLHIRGTAYTDVIAEQAKGTVTFLDKPLRLKSSLLFVGGRLYLPMKEFVVSLGGTVAETDDKFAITWSAFQYDISKEHDEILAQPLFYHNHTAYVSVYDIGQLFHLAVLFNSQKNTVGFYYRTMPEPPDASIIDQKGKAYLRLEDVSAQEDNDNAALEKMRVIFDYLYSEGQHYHIAWIPLYLNPPKNIANDLTKNFNFYNADFLYTLDYAINHNGHLVLHGYTHQAGDSVSGYGTEFGESTPYSLAEVDNRMKQAKEIAGCLGYDDSIFEFPHTESTVNQLRVAENNFKVIYQQSYYNKRSMGKTDTIRREYRSIFYVPTPVGYLPTYEDLPDLLNRIEQLPKDHLISMFVHPYLEYPQIQCETNAEGMRVFRYNDKGIYKQLVKKVREEGKTFSQITAD